jgi:hypothetical protein
MVYVSQKLSEAAAHSRENVLFLVLSTISELSDSVSVYVGNPFPNGTICELGIGALELRSLE